MTLGYHCIDFRKWYQPYHSNDTDIKPSKRGVAIRLDEWVHLSNLIDAINTAYPTLASVVLYYYGDDHLNQMEVLNCSQCHPFFVNLGQPPVA